MAWTAKLETAERVKTDARVHVVYTNGAEEISEVYNVSADDHLTAMVRAKVKALEAVDAYVLAAKKGAVDIAQPPGDGHEPTDEEVARAAWLANYQLFKRVRAAIDAGVLDGDEEEVDALRSAVRDGYKPEYLTLL